MSKTRFPWLDHVRGFAVITMFMQHAMLMLAKGGGEEGVLGILFLAVGTVPAAPAFLLVMGIFLGRSTRKPHTLMIRGLKLLLLGYLLNLLRFTAPILLLGGSGDHALAFEMLGEVDIFQVAGLGFVFGGLLKLCKTPSSVLLIIAILIAGISPLLWGIGEKMILTDLLWGTSITVSPLGCMDFSWYGIRTCT